MFEWLLGKGKEQPRGEVGEEAARFVRGLEEEGHEDAVVGEPEGTPSVDKFDDVRTARDEGRDPEKSKRAA